MLTEDDIETDVEYFTLRNQNGDDIEYIARLYIHNGKLPKYGEICYAQNNTRAERKMRSLAKARLKPYGIIVPKHSKKLVTHRAIEKLVKKLRLKDWELFQNNEYIAQIYEDENGKYGEICYACDDKKVDSMIDFIKNILQKCGEKDPLISNNYYELVSHVIEVLREQKKTVPTF